MLSSGNEYDINDNLFVSNISMICDDYACTETYYITYVYKDSQ